MGLEIERKFLVNTAKWQPKGPGTEIRQGYLSLTPERVVRIRQTSAGCWLTIKGKSRGAVRSEFEYPIPRNDAEMMLSSVCIQPVIEKTRYKIEFSGKIWEVDVFKGENSGLVLAEIELESENDNFKLPDWVGLEVTGDSRFYNVNLVRKPYSEWENEK